MCESFEFIGEFYKQVGELEKIIPVKFSADSLDDLYVKYMDNLIKGKKESLKIRRIHLYRVKREEIDWD